MSDVAGQVVLITGANTGIGRVTAVELARRGARVFLAGRSLDRTRPVLDEIRKFAGDRQAEFLPLDLSSFESVRHCAETFLGRDVPLQLLINNAGLTGGRGSKTADGFELAFGTNHLGHFLLTALLLPRLHQSAPARIVNVASKAHFSAKKLDLDEKMQPTQSVSGLPEYNESKLANVLYTRELARRLEGRVTTYSLHPGVIASDLWRRVPWPFRPIMKAFMISNEEGARTTLWCATAHEVADRSGSYFDECKEYKPSELAQNDELAAELFRRSEQWTGVAV